MIELFTSPLILGFVLLGTALGIIVGAIPGMTGTIDTITRQQPGYGLDIYSGTYTFYVPGEAPVPARYSFVVGPSRHGPTILNHHSSAMPS